MLYILTSVCVLCTPNAGQNFNFKHFEWQKAKKRRKKLKICGKMCVYSQIKTIDKSFGTNLKIFFFVKLFCKFLTFFAFFSFIAQKRRKYIFRPVFGVPSTQTLVKIYSTKYSEHLNTVLISVWFMYC